MTLLLVLVGTLVGVVLLAFAGVTLGSRIQRKKEGAGFVEQSLRGGLEPSIFGALLGILPVLVFVGALIVIARQHAEQEAREAEYQRIQEQRQERERAAAARRRAAERERQRAEERANAARDAGVAGDGGVDGGAGE